MEYEILSGLDEPQSIRELFEEYFAMILAGDDNFTQYLSMQNSDEELAHLEGKYGPPYGRLYILRKGGQLAGCIGLRRMDGGDCEMKRLYVRPEFRGYGFGRVLVERILADARSIGYKRMLLDTLPFLDSAVALYRRCGFQEIAAYNDSPMIGTIYMQYLL